jgi:hypothetical protein
MLARTAEADQKPTRKVVASVDARVQVVESEAYGRMGTVRIMRFRGREWVLG